MSIAGKLRNARYRNIFILLQRRGVSQTKIAAIIGTTPQIISDWKTDRKNPSIFMLERIADYFNVSVDFLIGRVTDESPGSQSNQTNGELVQNLTAIMSDAEMFADEAVERYGADNRYNPLSTSLKAGICQLIEELKSQ
jgi:transcriptional regulator with XRE-family HTH domain